MMEKKQVALLFMATLVSHTVSILIFLITGIIMVRSQPKNNFVQLTSGETIAAKTVDLYHREPETIRRFVNDTVVALFNWTGFVNIVDDQGQPRVDADVGISLGSGKRIPTTTYQASFAITERVRGPFLENLATLVPQDLFNPIQPGQPSRKPRLLARVRYIGMPQERGKGLWDVELVADLVLFSPSAPQGRLFASFNKIVKVRATEQSRMLVRFPKRAGGLAYDDIDRLIYGIQQAGLEIVDFRDFPVAEPTPTVTPTPEVMP